MTAGESCCAFDQSSDMRTDSTPERLMTDHSVPRTRADDRFAVESQVTPKNPNGTRRLAASALAGRSTAARVATRTRAGVRAAARRREPGRGGTESTEVQRKPDFRQ